MTPYLYLQRSVPVYQIKEEMYPVKQEMYHLKEEIYQVKEEDPLNSYQSINPISNQSINQSINQTINQSINQISHIKEEQNIETIEFKVCY